MNSLRLPLALAFLGERRRPAKMQHRHAAAGGVVHGAGQRLRAALDVHQHRLRPAGDLREAVRGAQRRPSRSGR